MITPILEKAILSGIATVQNYAVGGAGVCRINIPDDHIAYLTGFSYYPYSVDGNWFADATIANVTDNDKNLFQEVDFYSGNLTRKWVFKIQQLIQQADQAQHLFNCSPGEFKVDTLVAFTKDIFVEFKLPQVGNAPVVDFGTLLNNQDPGLYTATNGEGYGNSFNTVKMRTYVTGRRYYPAGIDNATTGDPGRTASDVISGINDTVFPEEMYNRNSIPSYNINCASMNICLVLVNKQYNDNLFK